MSNGVTSLAVGVRLIVLEITVPGGVPALTLTTIGTLYCVPFVTAAPEQLVPVPGQQLIDPVPPAAGTAVQIIPVGVMPNDTSVVFVGTAPAKTMLLTLAGPWFAMVCV